MDFQEIGRIVSDECLSLDYPWKSQRESICNLYNSMNFCRNYTRIIFLKGTGLVTSGFFSRTDAMTHICEIGVGETPTFENSVRIDIRKTPSVTIIADARHLPFKNEVFDHIYSSHTIEHSPHGDISAVLQEWMRICIPGGTIELRCPDLRARALLFFLQPTIQNIKNIYGGQDYPENFHQSGFSYGILKRLLEQCGVHRIRRIADGYKGIPFIPNDLHIIGRKKSNDVANIKEKSK